MSSSEKLVVIVDDHQDIRTLLQTYLDTMGWKTAVFSDGAQAMEFISREYKKGSIHAIISDLMMAQSDGVDLLASVRKIPDLQKTKFLLITGADPKVFESLIKPYRVDAILAKPCDLEKVHRVLNYNSERKAA